MLDLSMLNNLQFDAFLTLRYQYWVQDPTLRQINYFILYGRVIDDCGVCR